jgi:hypothetical protein
MVRAKRLLPEPEKDLAAWLAAFVNLDVSALSLQELQ